MRMAARSARCGRAAARRARRAAGSPRGSRPRARDARRGRLLAPPASPRCVFARPARATPISRVSFIPSLPQDRPRRAADAPHAGFRPGVLAPDRRPRRAAGLDGRLPSSASCSACSPREPGVGAVARPGPGPRTRRARASRGRARTAAPRASRLPRRRAHGRGAIADLERLEDRMPELLRERGPAAGAASPTAARRRWPRRPSTR